MRRNKLLAATATTIGAALLGLLANIFSSNLSGNWTWISIVVIPVAAAVMILLESRERRADKRQEASFKALTVYWNPEQGEGSRSRSRNLHQILRDPSLPHEYRIVLGWSELESKMMNVVYGSTGRDLPGRPIASIIRDYAKQQQLGNDDVLQLQRIVNFRNRAVHGGDISETPAEQEELIGNLVKQLSIAD
jgi:4-amino-4-deoxy-L-arabinose transferase-like glycosyltransferase